MGEEGENEVGGWQCCGAEPHDAGEDYLHGQYMEISDWEDGFNRGRWTEHRIQNAAMRKALRVESKPGCTCICIVIVYVIVVSGEGRNLGSCVGETRGKITGQMCFYKIKIESKERCRSDVFQLMSLVEVLNKEKEKEKEKEKREKRKEKSEAVKKSWIIICNFFIVIGLQARLQHTC